MRIIDARWTPQINLLVISCGNHFFEHRADRWRVVCPRCKKQSDLKELRKKYVNECYAKGVQMGKALEDRTTNPVDFGSDEEESDE